MMNNTRTLSCEIKERLRYVNYPLLFGGSFAISTLGLLMVFGYHPNLINTSLNSILRFTLTMSGAFVALLIGLNIGIVISDFYRPKVKQYIDAPKDIEIIQNALISLGSFVTTIDNAVNSKQIGRIFYYIINELKKIPLIHSDIKM